jgi:hypothetical protein
MTTIGRTLSTGAHRAERPPNTLDADAGRLIRYLQRGGNQSYYLTFDANGHAHATWYNSGGLPPWPPAGTNVYFGVNPCTAIPATNAAGKPAKPENVRGRVENIAALNCLYAEFDAKDFGGMVHGVPLGALKHIHNLPTNFAPSVTVASGGGFHCYWLLAEPFVLDTPEKREQAVAIQRDWVTFVRGDKAAKDIARVLRVPGTLNYKYEPARPVAFFEQAYNRRYHFQILELELDDWRQTANAPRTPRTARTPKPDAPARQADALQPGVAQPAIDLMAISKAAAALARLRVERRDEYTGWLHVGMALRELGDDGLWLWQRWSEASPKYNVGDCQDKWQTFRVGTPGGTDITLASLYRYADEDGEPVRTLDDAERLQLQDLQARELQTTRILAMKAPLAAKAVWVGMLPRLDAKRVLVADRAEHSGSLAVNYETFADIMNTSKTSVSNYVELGEQAGLWRKDAEYKETKGGYEVKLIRLDLQPAHFNPELAQPLERNTHGGKRAGAGRKPKCPDCPPRTRVLRKTEITYVCAGCRQVLDAEPSRFELMPDDAPVVIQDETVDALPMDATRQAEHAAEFNHETGTPAANVETNAPEFKMKLVNARETPLVLLPFHLEKTRAELVPVALTETFDMPTAIRLADTYAPDDAAERLAFKTGLTWLQRGEHEKAAAAAANVHDERAHAILLHLAERTPAIAPGLRE